MRIAKKGAVFCPGHDIKLPTHLTKGDDDMARTITFKGNPLALFGRVVKIGDPAPDFRVTSQDMEEIRLGNFSGKIKVISSFPSLDTPVCDLQVKEFNKRSAGFSSDVVVIGISKDLPFAQKRFCGEHDIKNPIASDYKYSSFGLNYGLLIKDLNLLARAVTIVDRSDIIRYSSIVPELTTPPDYEDALKNLAQILKSGPFKPGRGEGALPSRCTPCERGTPPLPQKTVETLFAQYRGWELVEAKKITKEFKFKDFADAKLFVDAVSVTAEEQGHHPSVVLSYGKVRISLTTHASGGLTQNDFIMAKIIDGID